MEEHHLEYREIKLGKNFFTEKDLMKILSLTENGFDDLLSKRSTAFKKIEKSYEEGTLPSKFIIEVILNNPEMMKFPIIHDDVHLQIGFNSDDIRQFIPRQDRKIIFSQQKR